MLYEKKKKDTFVAENAGNPLGEMLEWLKRHAWKACIRHDFGRIPADSCEKIDFIFVTPQIEVQRSYIPEENREAP